MVSIVRDCAAPKLCISLVPSCDTRQARLTRQPAGHAWGSAGLISIVRDFRSSETSHLDPDRPRECFGGISLHQSCWVRVHMQSFGAARNLALSQLCKLIPPKHSRGRSGSKCEVSELRKISHYANQPGRSPGVAGWLTS